MGLALLVVEGETPLRPHNAALVGVGQRLGHAAEVMRPVCLGARQVGLPGARAGGPLRAAVRVVIGVNLLRVRLKA
jgi:hypothetical protein